MSDFLQVIKQCVVWGLKHPENWSSVFPMKKRFVGFGQQQCGTLEALVSLFDTEKISYNIITMGPEGYKKDKQTSRLKNRTDVTIICNAQYLPGSIHTIPLSLQNTVFIALCDVPYYEGRAAPEWRHFWDEKFDYHATRNIPSREKLVEYFEKQFQQWRQNVPNLKITIDKEACETLADCSDGCLYSDVKEFCKKIVYDAIYKKSEEISLDYIMTEYFSDESDSGLGKRSITERPTMSIQARFEKLASNKKIKLH